MPPIEEISGTYRADIRHLSPPSPPACFFASFLRYNLHMSGFFRNFATDMKKIIMILLAVALVVVGCKDRTSEKMQQAQVLRDQARTEFLDSALQKAQQELAQTDSLLEAAKVRHQQLQQAIKKDPYSKRLERELTEARRLVDSLQVSWNTQGAKIKYLHRKQKQP